LIAVMLASVLGSLHCVGMCGPFAIWVSGMDNALSRGTRINTMIAYHLGRLTTYLSAGLMAGIVGSAIAITGHVAGYQSLAAKVAGTILIAAGIVRLLGCLTWFQKSATDSILRPGPAAALLQRAKPILSQQQPVSRGFLTGLLTTWLPCGWLYLFVLFAAGTGDIASSFGVMAAFWVGTLPALTGVVMGAGSVLRRFPRSIPLIAGSLLILTGLATASGRAAADLSSITLPPIHGDINWASLSSATEQPMPCCDVIDDGHGITPSL
ncbi:MAG: sulfite exporter TauE/SafE family protein, partial [Planctomycetota bacterium]